MTIVIVVLVLLAIASALRWRKLRRDARRRRWNVPHDSDPRENVPRVRIVGENHVPADPLGPVVRPSLDSERLYLFGENLDDSPLRLGATQQRDRALERAGRRRRRFRSARRRS
jgi:hypothetical protein